MTFKVFSPRPGLPWRFSSKEATTQEIQEAQAPPLGWDNPLKGEMAARSSIRAWKMPWTEKAGLSSGYTVHRVPKESDTTQRSSNSNACCHHFYWIALLWVSSQYLKERKCMRIWKEETEVYLFTDKMIIAMENPNVSTNKLLKLFYQISNFTGEFTCKNQFYFYIAAINE